MDLPLVYIINKTICVFFYQAVACEKNIIHFQMQGWLTKTTIQKTWQDKCNKMDFSHMNFLININGHRNTEVSLCKGF